HAGPTTPVALVNVIVEEVAVPFTVAVPRHTVPSAAVPLKVNCPSTAEFLTVALNSPSHLTDVEFQVPRTSDPDCASTMAICIVTLLDEAIVPFHVPAMLVVVTAEPGLGAVELPPHAAILPIRQTSSAIRIVPLVVWTSLQERSGRDYRSKQISGPPGTSGMPAHARAGIGLFGERPVTISSRLTAETFIVPIHASCDNSQVSRQAQKPQAARAAAGVTASTIDAEART